MSFFSIDVAIGGHSAMVHHEDGCDEQWIETFTVLAETSEGRRYELIGSHTRDEAAAKAILLGTSSSPITRPDLWEEVDPRYGSDAWGPENEYDLACFEADCFGEPRPRW